MKSPSDPPAMQNSGVCDLAPLNFNYISTGGRILNTGYGTPQVGGWRSGCGGWGAGWLGARGGWERWQQSASGTAAPPPPGPQGGGWGIAVVCPAGAQARTAAQHRRLTPSRGHPCVHAPALSPPAPQVNLPLTPPPSPPPRAPQVNLDPGNVCIVGGMKLQLLQYHFHAPSEHARGGVRAPMEVHLVHRNLKTGEGRAAWRAGGMDARGLACRL